MKIGYTSGVFDLFHIGHLNILKQAKEKCDYLIVACSTDELTHSLKGKYPIISFSERFKILEALKYVDKVVPEEDDDKLLAHKLYNFDIIFKGSDWANTDKWKSLEREFIKHKVDVVFIAYTSSISSSKIKLKILDNEYQNNDWKYSNRANP